MGKLSISKAWDETKAITARDGKLYGAIAFALIGLPWLILGLVAPEGTPGSARPGWTNILLAVVSIVGVAAQLAIVRLAIGPSTTVGDAIAHGFRRMPALLGAIVIIVCAIVIPLAIVATLAGVPVDGKMTAAPSAGLTIVILVLLAMLTYVGVRMMLSAPVASAERLGPIGIIKRSWALSAGNFWALFGFLITFIIAAIIVALAIGAAVGAVVALLLGPIEPMSASALVVSLVQAVFNAVVTLFLEVMTARIYIQLAGLRDTVPADA